MVAQPIKLLLVMLASCIKVPVQVPVSLCRIHLPTNMPENTLEDGSSAWEPTIPDDFQDEIPGFLLLFCLYLAVRAL